MLLMPAHNHIRFVVLVCLFVTCGQSEAEQTPVVTLHAEESQATEADGFSFDAVVAVVRTGDAAETLDVKLSISGTAENGRDYRSVSPEIQFAKGERIRRVRIQPLDDGESEGPETVVLSLMPSEEESDLRSDAAGNEGKDWYHVGPPSQRSVTVTISGEISPEDRDSALVFQQDSDPPVWVGEDDSHDRFEVSDAELPLKMVDAVSVNHAGNPWEVALRWPLLHGVRKGDEVLVQLFARRTPESKRDVDGKFTVRIQHDEPPYDGTEQTFVVGSQWRPYLMRATVTEELPGGQSSLDIRVGYGKQKLEIGGLRLWNFGDTPPPNLPHPVWTYEGREADAAWRAGLDERIDRVRSERVRLEFDHDARDPVAYRYRQTDAEYEIGTAVNFRWVAPTSGESSSTADAQRYQAFVKKYFDRITDENSQQWVSWEQNPQRAIETAAWAIDNGLKIRGHSVLWGDPVEWPSPPDLWEDYQKNLKKPNGGVRVAMLEMRSRIAAHIRQNTLVALSGNIDGTQEPIIAQWDVLNHPILHDRMWEITGWEFLRAAIREARLLANPKTEFFVNEDQVLSLPSHPNAEPLFQLIRSFLDVGVPVDGIGFQCHFKSDRLPSIESIQATLERFAGFGLQLHVTEFDIDDVFIDAQTQADFTRDFLDLLAAEPAVTATTIWGFWEGEHWRSEEGAAMYDRAWNLRPNGQAFIDHVDRRWHSITFDESDSVAEISVANVMLRRGTYEINSLDAAGRVGKVWRVTVSPSETEFELRQ